MSRKTFFTRHAKSSAVFISLGIHALLLVVALSFVAAPAFSENQKGDADETPDSSRQAAKA